MEDQVLAVYDYDGVHAERAIVISEYAGPYGFRVSLPSGGGIRRLWHFEAMPAKLAPLASTRISA